MSRNLGVMHVVENGFYPPAVSLGLMYSSGQPCPPSSSLAECRGQGLSGGGQESIVKFEALETETTDGRCCPEQGKCFA